MSTRGEIHIYNCDGEQFCRIYNHSDSYPKGLGLKIMQFLQDKKIVNGIGINDHPKNTANGIEDLAAQLIVELKREKPLGGVYVFPAFANIDNAKKEIGSDIEYVYSLVEDGDAVKISVNFGEMMNMSAFENFVGKEFEKCQKDIPEKPLAEAVFIATAIQSFIENYPGAGSEDCVKLAEYIDSRSYLPRSKDKAEIMAQKFADALQGQISDIEELDYESIRVAEFLGISPKLKM